MRKPEGPLRTGFTTGACATAAATAAARRLWTGERLDAVEIALPGGERPRFALVDQDAGRDDVGCAFARAGVVKDAGDDPDVTHGVTLRATLRPGAAGSGLMFSAGEGVGRVTKPGLPLAVGEPAINPGPRAMIEANLAELAHTLGRGWPLDLSVEIAIPGGAAIAEKTWNPRLGIVGGLSVLGTTGVVRPFSCAAWIASIHRGVDVARASGITHAIAATGATSEAAARARWPAAPDHAMLDMGDFAGGLLKYLKAHPLPRLTIAGGVAKLVKLGQGALDLHSGRSQVDFAALAALVDDDRVAGAETVLHALELVGAPLAQAVADAARKTALRALGGASVAVEVLAVDRAGRIVGISGGFS